MGDGSLRPDAGCPSRARPSGRGSSRPCARGLDARLPRRPVAARQIRTAGLRADAGEQAGAGAEWASRVTLGTGATPSACLARASIGACWRSTGAPRCMRKLSSSASSGGRGWAAWRRSCPPKSETWPAGFAGAGIRSARRASYRSPPGVVDADCRLHGVGEPVHRRRLRLPYWRLGLADADAAGPGVRLADHLAELLERPLVRRSGPRPSLRRAPPRRSPPSIRHWRPEDEPPPLRLWSSPGASSAPTTWTAARPSPRRLPGGREVIGLELVSDGEIYRWAPTGRGESFAS